MTSGVFNRFDQIIVNRDERQRREGGTDSSTLVIVEPPSWAVPLVPEKSVHGVRSTGYSGSAP
jgi:hypothetical protein